MTKWGSKLIMLPLSYNASMLLVFEYGRFLYNKKIWPLIKKCMMMYVATTSKLHTNIQASIVCMSSEKGRNGYLTSHNTNMRSGDRFNF